MRLSAVPAWHTVATHVSIPLHRLLSVQSALTVQPPVVAAIVDFEGGGRLSCELTDVEPKSVAIGNALEVEEALLALDGKGPEDLQLLVRAFAVEMMILSGSTTDRSAATISSRLSWTAWFT